MKRLGAVLFLLLSCALAAWRLASSAPDGGAPPEPAPTPLPDAPDDATPAAAPRARVATVDAAEPAPEDAPDVAAAAPSDMVVVRVRDLEGQPVDGADVAVLAASDDGRDEFADPAWAADPVGVVFARGRAVGRSSRGEVRVPRGAGRVWVAAVQGRSRGLSDIEPGDDDPADVTLYESVAVTISVVDAAGAPAPRISVAIVVHERDDQQYLTSRTETGADGTVLVYVAQLGQMTFSAQVCAPGLPLVTAPIDVDAADAARVELRLPDAVGVLDVVLRDVEGAPFDGAAQIDVAGADDAPPAGVFASEDPRVLSRRVHGGEERVAPVGVGGRLRVTASDPAGRWAAASTVCDAPAVPGASARVELTVGAARPVVVGRLVTTTGEPLADEPIVARVVSGADADAQPWERIEATTDAAGRFRIVVDAPPEGVTAVLQLGRRRADVEWASVVSGTEATAELPGLRAGVEIDVGDMVTAASAPLVSGRVLDAAGAPIAGAELRIRVARRWGTVPLRDVEGAVSAADGSFELRGVCDENELAIDARARGAYLPEPVRVTLGATGVDLRLQPAGGIAGSVRIPPGMDVWQVQVYVVRSETSRAAGGATTVRRERVEFADPDFSEPSERAQFEYFALPPGSVRVEVCLGWGSEEPVVAIDDIAVVAGEITRDPRLADIDLSAAARSVRVTVVGDDGKPLPAASVHVRVTDGGWDDWREFECGEDGVANVLFTTEAAHLLVVANGYRSVEVDAASGERTVRLVRTAESRVRVRLAADVALPPPPTRLTVALEWVGPPGASLPQDESELGFGDDPRNVGDDETAFGATRSVEFAVGDPGVYRVVVWRWTTTIDGASGSPLGTDPPLVFVTVPGEGAQVEVTVRPDLRDEDE